MQNRLSSDLEEIFATIKNSSLLIFEVLKNSMGEYTQNTTKQGIYNFKLIYWQIKSFKILLGS